MTAHGRHPLFAVGVGVGDDDHDGTAYSLGLILADDYLISVFSPGVVQGDVAGRYCTGQHPGRLSSQDERP